MNYIVVYLIFIYYLIVAGVISLTLGKDLARKSSPSSTSDYMSRLTLLDFITVKLGPQCACHYFEG